jgi:MFS family permease
VVLRRVFSWARRTPYLAGLPRDVAVLSFVAFSVALGYGIAAPAIPVYARTFGVSAFVASTVISAFALMRLISAGPAGLAVDRWGERRVMSLGVWIVALSSLATAAAQTFPQLLVLRALGGIGSAMFTVSAMALLLRTAGPEQRGRAAGAWQAGFLFGGVAGPAIGGVVTTISIRAPFVVYGVTLIVAGLIAARFLSPQPSRDALPGEEPTPPPPPPAALGAALRQAAYRAALMVSLATGFIIFGLRISIAPLFVTEGLRLAVAWVGAGFVLAAGVQAVMLIPAGRRTDSSGRRGSLLIGTSTLAASMVLLAVDTGWPGLLLAMGVSGLASAFLGSASGAVVGDVTRGRSGGRVVSVYQMVGDLGGIIGPLAAGALADALGFGWAFGAGAVVAVIALGMVVVMPETLDRPSPEPR